MKYSYLLAAVLALGAAGASAVELNTEALKKMQKEGLERLEEQQGARTFGLSNGQCLNVAGAPDKAGTNVKMAKCNAEAKTQQWRFDDKGRLQSAGGLCLTVAGAQQALNNALLKTCQGGKNQQWQLDDAGRLVNGLGQQCLQGTRGNAMTAACNQAGNQKWQ